MMSLPIREAILRKIQLIVLSLFLLGISSSYVFAASDDTDNQIIKRETKLQKSIEEVEEKARSRRSLENLQYISFEDVLKDPDNVDLNFKYSQQQVKENDLLGAAGTLERILMVRPDLHEIRLFYAVVLYRLDNTVEAERELNALTNAQLPEKLRGEWKTYRREIKLRKKKTKFTLRESLGYARDSNRNAVASSKQLLFADTRIDVSPQSRSRSDHAFLNITNFDVSHDLGFQAGHEVIGSFTYYLQEQQQLQSLDLGSFQYEVGGVYKTKWFNFTPTFFASHVFLSDENYLRGQGGNFEFSKGFTKWDHYLNYRVEHQDFLPISEIATAGQRDGMEHTVSSGTSYALTSDMRVSAGIAYLYKNAKADYEGYRRLSLRFGHTWLLGKGQFLVNSIEPGFDRYNEPDIAIAARLRTDNNMRYRVTYGAPLTFFYIGKFLPRQLQDITVSATYEYYRTLSNITNYTYTNHKFQGLISKKLEF